MQVATGYTRKTMSSTELCDQIYIVENTLVLTQKNKHPITSSIERVPQGLIITAESRSGHDTEGLLIPNKSVQAFKDFINNSEN